MIPIDYYFSFVTVLLVGHIPTTTKDIYDVESGTTSINVAKTISLFVTLERGGTICISVGIISLVLVEIIIIYHVVMEVHSCRISHGTLYCIQ